MNKVTSVRFATVFGLAATSGVLSGVCAPSALAQFGAPSPVQGANQPSKAVVMMGNGATNGNAMSDEINVQLEAMRERALKHPWAKTEGTESPDKSWRVVFAGTTGQHDIYIVPQSGAGYTHLSGAYFDNAPDLQAVWEKAPDGKNWIVSIVGDAKAASSSGADGALVRVEFQPQFVDFKGADGRVEHREVNGGGVAGTPMLVTTGGNFVSVNQTSKPVVPHMIQSPNPDYSHAYYFGAGGFPRGAQSTNTPEMFDPKSLLPANFGAGFNAAGAPFGGNVNQGTGFGNGGGVNGFGGFGIGGFTAGATVNGGAGTGAQMGGGFGGGFNAGNLLGGFGFGANANPATANTFGGAQFGGGFTANGGFGNGNANANVGVNNGGVNGVTSGGFGGGFTGGGFGANLFAGQGVTRNGFGSATAK